MHPKTKQACCERLDNQEFTGHTEDDDNGLVLFFICVLCGCTWWEIT